MVNSSEIDKLILELELLLRSEDKTDTYRLIIRVVKFLKELKEMK